MSYIQVGHFEADGASVALTWDKEANPDFLLLVNYTKAGTDANNFLGFWFRDYPSGDLVAVVNEADAGIGVLETTNGITANDSVAYADTNNQTSASHTLNLTLGSAIYGSDSDELYYLAIWSDKFTDHGDINA